MALSKEEKKALKAAYAGTQKKDFLLSPEQAGALFDYLEETMEETPCDNTLRWTRQWVDSQMKESLQEAVLEEIRGMGGYCDCEVILNCYEDYDL